MSVRLLLAAIVALALLSSSLPLVQESQRARADRQVSASADDLRDTVVSMARQNDPVPLGVPGARSRVSVDLPDNGGPTELRIGARPDGTDGDTNTTDVLWYRVAGEDPVTIPVGVDVRVWRGAKLASDDTALVVRDDSTLTVGYHVVSGTPVVTVGRGFKPGNRTSQSHV